MLISSAWAHGSSGAESPGGVFPFVLLTAAVVSLLVYLAYSQWRKYRARREGGGE